MAPLPFLKKFYYMGEDKKSLRILTIEEPENLTKKKIFAPVNKFSCPPNFFNLTYI